MLSQEDMAMVQGIAYGGGRGTDLSSYEHFKVADRAARRPNGATVAAVTLGAVGTALAVGAWVFGPIYAAGRAKGNQSLIEANAAHSRQMQDLLANNILNERSERVNYIQQQNPTLRDYINVQQSGSQSTSATSSALAQAEATLLAGALTGQVQSCPQKVSLYSAPQPCACPGTCG